MITVSDNDNANKSSKKFFGFPSDIQVAKNLVTFCSQNNFLFYFMDLISLVSQKYINTVINVRIFTCNKRNSCWKSRNVIAFLNHPLFWITNYVHNN